MQKIKTDQRHETIWPNDFTLWQPFHVLCVLGVKVTWTCLRGVSSTASSSSTSLSQSHGAFRFFLLHSHPCFRPALMPSTASSEVWGRAWSLLPRPPILIHTHKLKVEKKLQVYWNRAAEINIKLKQDRYASGLWQRCDKSSFLGPIFCLSAVLLLSFYDFMHFFKSMYAVTLKK